MLWLLLAVVVVLLWCQLLNRDIPAVGADAGRPIGLRSIRNRTAPFALPHRRGRRLRGVRKRRRRAWSGGWGVARVHIHRVDVTSVVVLMRGRSSRRAAPGSCVTAAALLL